LFGPVFLAPFVHLKITRDAHAGWTADDTLGAGAFLIKGIGAATVAASTFAGIESKHCMGRLDSTAETKNGVGDRNFVAKEKRKETKRGLEEKYETLDGSQNRFT